MSGGIDARPTSLRIDRSYCFVGRAETDEAGWNVGGDETNAGVAMVTLKEMEIGTVRRDVRVRERPQRQTPEWWSSAERTRRHLTGCCATEIAERGCQPEPWVCEMLVREVSCRREHRQ